MSTITTETAEPQWIYVAGADRYLETGPVYLSEARQDGTHFNACITPGNSTTTDAPGYQLEVVSDTGPGWSTHAETLAEAQGDFAAYLRATPDDADEPVDENTTSTTNATNTTKETHR